MEPKKLLQRLILIRDVTFLPWIALRLLINPDNIEPIAKLASFRNHASFDLSRRWVHSDPRASALVHERYVSAQKMTLEELERLPAGSLGREYSGFLQRYHLNPNFYAPITDSINDDIVYMRNRGQETHDIWHLVCGVTPDSLGEVKLSAVYVAQLRSPYNAFFIGIGIFYALFREPHRLVEVFDAISEGWQMGRQAKALFAVKWEEEWSRPLEEIRRELNLPLSPSGRASLS